MQVHKSSWCITILLILGVVTNGVPCGDKAKSKACVGNEPSKNNGHYIYNAMVSFYYCLVTQLLFITTNDKLRLSVKRVIGSSFALSSDLDGIDIGTGGKDLTSHSIAYRQNYLEAQGSRLAVGFINLEKLFPCAKGAHYMPPCTRLTQDEDGFNKGGEFLEATDHGNSMKIFGTDIGTYGFAFKGCTKFTGTPPCLPKHYQFMIVCYLPARCRE